MIQGDALAYMKYELDDACSDSKFEDDFEMTFNFVPFHGDASTLKGQEIDPLFIETVSRRTNSEAVDCFSGTLDERQRKVKTARGVGVLGDDVPIERSGYLTKQGHQVANWKRRWFLLKDNQLTYMKHPKVTLSLACVSYMTEPVAARSTEARRH
jgi:hypothetical protein